MQTSQSRALSAASLASLLAALALSIPFVERVVAAAWQWYKFANYSDDGRISLSLQTGLFFSAALAFTFGLALGLNRAAKRQSAAQTLAWSRWSMYVAAVVAVSYWTLGMSSLNVWRI
ncbi:hypothetical protein [Sorangium sp. So ce1000]|uniref:hypothetical protein n=1 Tax=Sorangium sp. So ce1000 TaxID=3133325 RepID=UPI003F6132F4